MFGPVRAVPTQLRPGPHCPRIPPTRHNPYYSGLAREDHDGSARGATPARRVASERSRRSVTLPEGDGCAREGRNLLRPLGARYPCHTHTMRSVQKESPSLRPVNTEHSEARGHGGASLLEFDFPRRGIGKDTRATAWFGARSTRATLPAGPSMGRKTLWARPPKKLQKIQKRHLTGGGGTIL